MYNTILTWLAIVPPIIISLVGFYTVKQHGFNRKSTVSAIAALSPKTSRELGLTIAICTPLYYFALYLLIAPKYNLPFAAFFWTITLIAVLAMAYYPADKRRKRSYWIHSIAGVALALSMFILAALVGLSSQASSFVIITARVYVGFVVLSLLLMALVKQVRHEKLAVEVVFTAGFYILMALAALC